MARHYSPYSSHPRRPARWPKVLLILLLVTVAILSGAIIGGGQSPRSIYDDARDRVASVIDRGDDDDTPNTPEQPVAQATTPATTDPGATPAADQGAPVSGTPTPAGPNPDDPVSMAQHYGRLWAAADYDGLYDLLSTTAQSQITRDDFVGRYTAIAAEVGLTTITVTPSSQVTLDGGIPITVVMKSNYVGEITQENVLPMVREADGWRVNWTPSQIFTNLGSDCVDYTADTVERGSILDRNREPLAYNGKITQVGVIPGQITDEDELLEKLSDLLDMPESEIKDKYEQGQPDWFMPIKDYPEEMDTKTLSGLQGLGGVVVQSAISRVYPLAEQAAHLTGYVTPATADDLAADENGVLLPDQPVGRAGVEAAANDILAGVPGGKLQIVDCGARVEKELIAERKTEPGQDVILTVDITLQKAVDKAVTAEKGSAVVLDPRNGEILALVSHPTYNPNWFVLGFNSADWDYINDEEQRPLFNRAAEATYPTGSIFKVITMAAGLADLELTGDSEFDCPATWSIPGTDASFRDWTVAEGIGAQGRMTLHNALVTSCNTIFYQLGYQLDQKDNELLPAMTKAFGLGTPTGVPYYYEASGTVPDPAWKQEVIGDFWATGDSVNLSIGQGYLLATPLQMAVAYAAIANGGDVLQPYLVEYTADHETGKRERVGNRTVKSELPLTNAQVREIQSALRDQTSNSSGAGSSRIFADYDYPIAGKTGTAQNDLDRNETPHSWFAAFGPYGEESTITTIVMAENSGEGITVAAPITKTIFDAYRKTDLDEDG